MVSNYLQAQHKIYSNTCLYKDCNEKPINSHTISKSNLKVISNNNNNNNYFSLRYDKVIGIKEVFTYPIFCKNPDDEIFKSIDTCGYYIEKNVKQEF